MKITILASGSKGNSTLIETKTKNILIDVGLPLKNLETRLERSMPKIDILIITHTHSDHIKGIKSLLKKQKPTIYTLENNLEEKIKDTSLITHEKTYQENNITINLFELSHDVPCLGIHLKEEENELIYITDTGYIKEKLLKKYKNKTIYIIESNYEEELLTNGSYPFHLKQRIRSDKGHISNDDTCRYLKKLIGENTKYICLAHLSEENNKPEIAKEKVTNTINNLNTKPNKIIICSQTEKKEIIIWGKYDKNNMSRKNQRKIPTRSNKRISKKINKIYKTRNNRTQRWTRQKYKKSTTTRKRTNKKTHKRNR